MASSTSKVVIITLVTVGGVMLASCGCCFLGFFGILGAARSSPTYQQSLEVVKSSQPVIDKIGSPITEGMSTNLNFKSDNGVTKTEVTYSVNGPNGSATVTAETLDQGEGLQFNVHRVAFPDGTVVDLNAAAKADPQPDPDMDVAPNDSATPPVAPMEVDPNPDASQAGDASAP